MKQCFACSCTVSSSLRNSSNANQSCMKAFWCSGGTTWLWMNFRESKFNNSTQLSLSQLFSGYRHFMIKPGQVIVPLAAKPTQALLSRFCAPYRISEVKTRLPVSRIYGEKASSTRPQDSSHCCINKER